MGASFIHLSHKCLLNANRNAWWFLAFFFSCFDCVHLLNLLPWVTSLLEMQWFFTWQVRGGREGKGCGRMRFPSEFQRGHIQLEAPTSILEHSVWEAGTWQEEERGGWRMLSPDHMCFESTALAVCNVFLSSPPTALWGVIMPISQRTHWGLETLWYSLHHMTSQWKDGTGTQVAWQLIRLGLFGPPGSSSCCCVFREGRKERRSWWRGCLVRWCQCWCVCRREKGRGT